MHALEDDDNAGKPYMYCIHSLMHELQRFKLKFYYCSYKIFMYDIVKSLTRFEGSHCSKSIAFILSFSGFPHFQ
jgi:hypothetical protein